MNLAHVPLADVLPTDLVEIERAQKHWHGGQGPQELLAELEKDYTQLWLVRGLETRVLIATQILIHPKGNELKLKYIAGRGWFKHFGQILPMLEELAKFAGCRFFGGLVRGKYAYKFYERLGISVAGVYVYKDLESDERRADDHAGTEALEARSRWDSEYRGKGH